MRRGQPCERLDEFHEIAMLAITRPADVAISAKEMPHEAGAVHCIPPFHLRTNDIRRPRVGLARSARSRVRRCKDTRQAKRERQDLISKWVRATHLFYRGHPHIGRQSLPGAFQHQSRRDHPVARDQTADVQVRTQSQC